MITLFPSHVLNLVLTALAAVFAPPGQLRAAPVTTPPRRPLVFVSCSARRGIFAEFAPAWLVGALSLEFQYAPRVDEEPRTRVWNASRRENGERSR